VGDRHDELGPGAQRQALLARVLARTPDGAEPRRERPRRAQELPEDVVDLGLEGHVPRIPRKLPRAAADTWRMHERRLVALLLLPARVAPGVVGRPPGSPLPPAGGARPRADAPLAATLLFGGRLDLNAAGADDLAALPGIGPARARKIAAWRSRHGRFQR